MFSDTSRSRKTPNYTFPVRWANNPKIVSAKQLLANGMPPKEVATNLGVSVPTLYRWIPAAAQD